MSMVAAAHSRALFSTSFRPQAQRRPSPRVTVRRTLVVRADKDPEQAAKDAGKNIQEGASGVFNKAEDKLKNLSDQAGDVVEDASGEGRRQADKAEDSARGTANKVEKEGKGLGAQIKDGIRGAADAISGKAKDVKRNV